MNLRITLVLFLMLSILAPSKSSAQASYTYTPISNCAPASVSFTDQSIGATSWSWDFGNATSSSLQNPVAVYMNAGTYIATLTINGGSTFSDTILVDTLPQQPDTIYGNPVCCGGSILTFYIASVPGATSYNWTAPVGSVILNAPPYGDSVIVQCGPASGNIIVAALNNCGSSQFQVLQVMFGNWPDTTVSINGNNLISHAAINITYQWITCPGMTTINGATNQSFTPSQTGSYAVIVSDTLCMYIDTSFCHDIIIGGISDHINATGNVILYPNPASSSPTIKNISDFSLLQVANPLGEILYSEKISGKDEQVIDLHLAPGLYFVIVSNETGNSVGKLVME